MTWTNTYEDNIINKFLRNQSVSGATAFWLAAYTAAPSDTGGGTEVSASGYARQSLTFASPSAGATSNSSTITFTSSAPASWGTVTHVGVFDASTSGNLIVYGQLTSPKTVGAGGDLAFSAGQVTFELATGSADRTYLRHAVINHFLRNTAQSSASTLYLGLLQSIPAADGTGGNEVTGSGYARQAIAFSAPSGGVTSNSGTITFTTSAPADWGTVRQFGVFDASTSGNMLFSVATSTAYAITTGTPFSLAAGSVSYAVD